MNLQGYSRLSVALLLTSIYTAKGVTNSENSCHLPNAPLLSSSSHLPFPSLSLTLCLSLYPLLPYTWRCVCVCGVISTVACICVCLCVCEQLWILWGMHKRQQHLRDLSRLSKLSIFHSLWLYLCVPMLVCVCVFFWCLCTAANICHRQHSVYSIKYKYIIAE